MIANEAVQEPVQVPPATGHRCEGRTARLKGLTRQARTAAAVFTEHLLSPAPAPPSSVASAGKPEPQAREEKVPTQLIARWLQA